MPKVNFSQPAKKSNNKRVFVKNTEEGPFSNAMPVAEFMKHIRAIQQSDNESDVQLREAATNYMKSLRCV